LNKALPPLEWKLDSSTLSVTSLKEALAKSLKLRIQDIPAATSEESPDASLRTSNIAVLFSGGLDCTVLARLSHDILPLNEPIDLINVAFENPRVVQATKSGNRRPKRLLRKAEKIHRNGPKEYAGDNEAHEDTSNTVDEFAAYEMCPDRQTGKKSFAELEAVCPGRTWRFVEINIPYTETLSHRERVIALMHPHNTEMDISIAYAFYFAARGKGVERSLTDADGSPSPYSTPARVLLSGLGADELFGGYQRHDLAFERGGLPRLLEELGLDVNRLGKRNLGRDDRVISCWGKEARFPFLDENFVKWALATPVWEKCGFGEKKVATEDLNNPGGDRALDIEPGKKVLRLLAWSLGMHNVAMEKKRAVRIMAI
jgi:asparagine synthetase B (glutamine-hydrolysing)